MPGDIADKAAMPALAQQAVARWGRIAIVVNCHTCLLPPRRIGEPREVADTALFLARMTPASSTPRTS